MELEADLHRREKLGTHHNEGRSGIWWVTVIVIGVFIGNLLSFGAYQLYVQWELQQLAFSLKTEASALAERTKTEMERVAKRNEAARREHEAQNAANVRLLQTCTFWRQQVAKENSAKNRAYRDVACMRVTNEVQ